MHFPHPSLNIGLVAAEGRGRDNLGCIGEGRRGKLARNETVGIDGERRRRRGAARAAGSAAGPSGQKATDFKIKIADFALVKLIQLMVAAFESRAIGSHSEGLQVDAIVEAGDITLLYLTYS